MSHPTSDENDGTEQPPLLRIVKGDPTPEEVAALVTVISAMAAGAAAAATRVKRRREWSARHRMLRVTPRPGADGWRSSAR